MKTAISTIMLITFVFNGALFAKDAPSPEDTEKQKLISSINDKTRKIENEWGTFNKSLNRKAENKETNSYLFSLDENLLKIEYNEALKTYTNGKHTGTYKQIGTVIVDINDIDTKKLEFNKQQGFISLICKDLKKCLKIDGKIIDIYSEKGKTETVNKGAAISIALQGTSKDLAEKIVKDIKLLLPEPEDDSTDKINTPQ